jgi:hypothetical protein
VGPGARHQGIQQATVHAAQPGTGSTGARAGAAGTRAHTAPKAAESDKTRLSLCKAHTNTEAYLSSAIGVLVQRGNMALLTTALRLITDHAVASQSQLRAAVQRSPQGDA